MRAAQRPHLLPRAPLEAVAQVLAEARVAAQRELVAAPADGQVCVGEPGEPLRRVGMAERFCACHADLVEQRRRDEELALWLGELAEDLRREVAVQRVRLAAHAGDVVG